MPSESSLSSEAFLIPNPQRALRALGILSQSSLSSEAFLIQRDS